MSILKNHVLLLKADKISGSHDKYEDLLSSRNFTVVHVKTLTFSYKNINHLKEKLLKPEDYSGIILSSPRCVNAIQQALNKEELGKLWKAKYNYTVGETTHKNGLDKLDIDCRGRETGNAKNLSQLIIQNRLNLTKPFLFPHGNLKTDTLQIELAKENINIEGVLVYDTIANPNIEKEFAEVTNNFSQIPEFVIFFSPSGLHSSINYIRRVPVDLSLIKFIAIGPVTELAMIEENLKVYGVAKNPTAEDILDVITS